MAKGLEKHQQRQAQLAGLGKGLARRSSSRCELCGAAGQPLQAFEVPPAPPEPELELTAFLCPTCRQQLEKPSTLDSGHWRCAAESIWSEVPAVQALAGRVLRKLSSKELWAREALENAQLDQATETWIDQQPL